MTSNAYVGFASCGYTGTATATAVYANTTFANLAPSRGKPIRVSFITHP